MYDEIDVRHSYRTGFWIGAVTGMVSTFVICLLVGIFINS